MNGKETRTTALAVLVLIYLVTLSSHAAEGGYSNYIPGFYGDLALAVEPPDGWSMRNDFYYFGADGDGSLRSGQIEASADLTLVLDYPTVVYKPGVEVFGASLALGATAVIGYADIDASIQAGNLTADVQDDKFSFGDLTLSAYLYWSRDKLNFAWGNFVVAPIGDYDVDDIANTGLNYWTFETDFMATYFDEEKGRDYSIVVGYGYNTENNDTNYKTGDEFHIDVVLNQFLSENFAVGVSGFFFRQLSGDSGSGALLGDFEGEASGFGPNIYWIRNVFDKDVYFTAKWIHEFDVKNRLEGDHVFASFAFSF